MTGLGTGVKVASGQPESAGLFAHSVAFFVLQVGRGSPRTPDPPAPFYARPLPHTVGAPKIRGLGEGRPADADSVNPW